MLKEIAMVFITFFLLMWDSLFVNMFALIAMGEKERLRLKAKNYSRLALVTVFCALIGLATHTPLEGKFHASLLRGLLEHLPLAIPMFIGYRPRGKKEGIALFFAVMGSQVFFLLLQALFLEVARFVFREVQSDIVLSVAVMTPVKIWGFFLVGLHLIPFLFCHETRTIGFVRGKFFIHPLLSVVLAVNVFFGGVVVAMFYYGVLDVAGIPLLFQGIVLAALTSFPAINFLIATLMLAVHQSKATQRQLKMRQDVRYAVLEIKKRAEQHMPSAARKTVCALANEISHLVEEEIS